MDSVLWDGPPLVNAHNLVKYHQEVFHTQHHINRKEWNNQRKCKVFEPSPSGGSIDCTGFIHIFRARSATGNIDDGIHCNCLPCTYNNDTKPCSTFFCQNTGTQPFDSCCLTSCRKNISKEETKNITDNKSTRIFGMK